MTGKKRRRVEIFVEQVGGEVHFGGRIPPEPDEPKDPSMPPNKGWNYLSPLTVRVVQLLCREGWLSREEIAARLGEQADGKLGPLLTDMVERGILESSTRKGYHLAIPDGVDPEQFRCGVAEWIDQFQSRQS